MPLLERLCVDPLARLVVLGNIVELRAVIFLVLFFAHVVNAHHVPMTDEHEHGKVEDGSVQTEVLRNSLLNGPAPLLNRLLFHGREADSVPPIVAHLPQLVDQLASLSALGDSLAWVAYGFIGFDKL